MDIKKNEFDSHDTCRMIPAFHSGLHQQDTQLKRAKLAFQIIIAFHLHLKDLYRYVTILHSFVPFFKNLFFRSRDSPWPTYTWTPSVKRNVKDTSTLFQPISSSFDHNVSPNPSKLFTECEDECRLSSNLRL
jgi:hypothetical protein